LAVLPSVTSGIGNIASSIAAFPKNNQPAVLLASFDATSPNNQSTCGVGGSVSGWHFVV